MIDLKSAIVRKGEMRVAEIDVNSISPNPGQPRKIFSEADMESLTNSVRRHGVLQPLLVRETIRGRYELIAGERRLRAAKAAGLKKVPAIVRDRDDETSAIEAIVENIERRDLNFFEEAQALMRLMVTFNLTQEEMAKRIGRDQSTVANKMRILRLDENLRKKILENALTERHARLLLKLPADRRGAALNEIIAKGMNVAKSERFVSGLLKEKKRPKKPVYLIKDVRIFINTINNALAVMKGSGINASTQVSDLGDAIEYIIHIPKSTKIAAPGA